MSKAIPLLHFWAFVACYRVNFTFTSTFTTKITIVGAAHNNTNKNLNLRSSVTGLFNSDLRFQGQFSADGNCNHECWDCVEVRCTAGILKEHAAAHIRTVKVRRVVSGPGSLSEPARAPFTLMLYIAAAYSSKYKEHSTVALFKILTFL